MTISGLAMVDAGSVRADTVFVEARSATWDEELSDWRLEDGRRITMSSERKIDQLGISKMTPDLLWRLGKEGREVVELSYTDLIDLRELRPGRRDLELALQSHITFPLANVVLLLLALPFAVHFERGRRVDRVVFAIALCAAYLIFDLTCHNLGRSIVNPIVAAWLPTILFGSVGVVFFSGLRT